MSADVLPSAVAGDSYAWRLRFPSLSFLVGAPGNVSAQIRDDRDRLFGSWSVAVDGADLVLSLAEVPLVPGIYFLDVQVGATTYLRRLSWIIERQVSRP